MKRDKRQNKANGGGARENMRQVTSNDDSVRPQATRERAKEKEKEIERNGKGEREGRNGEGELAIKTDRA